jgi:hypothetical protein
MYVNSYLSALYEDGKVKSEGLYFDEVKFSLREHIDMVLDSKLISATRIFLLNLVSLRFFSRDTANNFIKTLGACPPCSILDFGLNTLTVVEQFVHFTGDLANGNGILTSLCRPDPFAKWLDLSVSIVNQAPNVYLGEDVNFPHLREVGKVDARTYMSELSSHIDLGKKLKEKGKRIPRIFSDRLYQLQDIKGGIFQKIASRNRMAPIGLILHGDPSIGKSSIIDHFTKVFCKAKGLQFSKDIIYHRPAVSDHWTGYEPLVQPVIHYSELGSMHANIAARTGDKTINELLNVIDSQPYQVEMADLEHKGKVFVLADLVIMDVNDPELNLKHIQSNPAAVRRRFLYIDIKVKPEFRKDGGTELDKNKIPHDLEDKMDLWMFTPYIQQSISIKDSIQQFIPNPITHNNEYNIYDISTFFFDRVLQHGVEQNKYKSAVSEEVDKYLRERDVHTMPDSLLSGSLSSRGSSMSVRSQSAWLTGHEGLTSDFMYDEHIDCERWLQFCRERGDWLSVKHTKIFISKFVHFVREHSHLYPSSIAFEEMVTAYESNEPPRPLDYEMLYRFTRLVETTRNFQAVSESGNPLQMKIDLNAAHQSIKSANEDWPSLRGVPLHLREQSPESDVYHPQQYREQIEAPHSYWSFFKYFVNWNNFFSSSETRKQCARDYIERLENKVSLNPKHILNEPYRLEQVWWQAVVATTLSFSFVFVPHTYILLTCPAAYLVYSTGKYCLPNSCLCHDFPWYKKLRYHMIDRLTCWYLEYYEAKWTVDQAKSGGWFPTIMALCVWAPRKVKKQLGGTKDFFYRWTADLLVFMFILLILKLILRIWKVVYSDAISQSEVVQSTNTFSEENADSFLHSFEEKSGCSFPLPKKKSEADKDYDKVESFLPRVVSDSTTLNKPEEVVNMVNKNLRYVHVVSQDKKISCSVGVGVCEDYMLLNKHCFLDKTYVEISMSPDKAVGITRHTFDERYTTTIGDDLILVRLVGVMFKDIRSLLIDLPSFEVGVPGYFNGSKVSVRHFTETVNVNNPIKNYTLTKGLVYDYGNHRDGLCGTPLLLTLNNRTIFVGIHTAAINGTTVCFSTIVSKTSLSFGLNLLKSSTCLSPIMSEGLMRLPGSTKLADTTSKSPLLFESTPGLRIVGSISPYSNVSPKSTLVVSPLLPHVEILSGVSPYTTGGNFKYLPPMMRSKRVNGRFVSPSNVWIKKVGVIKNHLPLSPMDTVVSSFSELLLARLRKRGVTSLTPYPLDVAQNGYPENFFIRAMKNGTSGGFMLPGKKSKYNLPTILEFKQDAVVPNFVVKEQVLETMIAYDRLENAHTLVGAQLKDEPRSHEKVVEGKTRVFAMSSYDSTLIQRMYLMPLYSLMCEHRDSFYTKVGINMHSSEAESMYLSLKEFSPYVMEGDYGGYDTSMPSGVGLMANSVVIYLLRELGYNSYALNKAQGILSDNLFPSVCLEGNIFVAPGFQPSGKYATAEDNSLRGVILLYYAYGIMCTSLGADSPHNLTQSFKLDDFQLYLLPITYGDDMLCGVKPSLAKYFNNITYARFVNEVYGMEFTTSDKNEQISEFVSVEMISFLKRKFVYNHIIKRHVAQLDRDSIMKSLVYILPSKEVSIDTQIVETCASSLRELFFHSESVEDYNSLLEVFVNKVSQVTCFSEKDIRKFFPTGFELFTKYSQE